MKEKVVLAYSGGLDTTAIIPWLKETFDYEVICCCINVGQGEELNGLEERAKMSGASKLYIEDIVDEFCEDYIVPCVQANAIYENKYLLGTSMARPPTKDPPHHKYRWLTYSHQPLPPHPDSLSIQSLRLILFHRPFLQSPRLLPERLSSLTPFQGP